MKKFDIKKILNDFKEIFKSTNNLKLVLSLVLILFILLFVVFGGCSGCGCYGCIDVSCHACSDGEKKPADTAGDPSQNDNTGEPAQNSGSDVADVSSVPGETYDTGVFTVLAPEGWKAFPVADFFSEEENAIDPESVQLGKGASDEFDLLVNPSISITYYGSDTDLMTPDSSWYDNATELSGFALGDFNWSGFEADDFLGGKVIILWTDSVNGVEYQANISYDPASYTISANDADVQAILASLKAN